MQDLFRLAFDDRRLYLFLVLFVFVEREAALRLFLPQPVVRKMSADAVKPRAERRGAAKRRLFRRITIRKIFENKI